MATEDLTFRFNVVGNAVPQFDKVRRKVQEVDRQIKRSNSTLRAHANQYNATSVATNKWAKGALQQAGYQIGDYAVQVANGTSKMQAFGQQGAQLLGIFGPVGAVLGAGVAIFSAIAVAMERSGKTAKSFSDSMSDLTSAISSYQSTLTAANQSTEDLGDQYGAAAGQARKLFEAQSSLKRLEAIDLLKKSVIALSDNFGSFADVSRSEIEKTEDAFNRLGDAVRTNYPPLSDQDLRAAIDAVEIFDSKIAGLKKTLGATDEQAFALAKELADLGAAEGPEQVSRELEDVRAQFLSIVGTIDAATDEQRELYAQLIQSAIAALDLGDNAKDAEETLGDAKEEAKSIADELARAATAVQGINTAAFDKLAKLQSELRARTRGLTDEQVRVQQAARKAELQAKKEGATGSELAAIAAQAAAAEREIIAAEKALLEFGDTGSSSVTKVKTKTKELIETLSPLQQKMQDVAKTIDSSMENAFMSVVDGTSSVKDAFRSMASEIIKELYRVFVVKQITGFITDAIGGFFNTNQVSGPAMPLGTGNVRPVLRSFSGGGYTGSGARAGGLDGKGGFMAMVHPRESIIDHTMGQSGGSGVVVNQTINVSTGIQQTVRTEIKSLMPQIAEGAKRAVVDAKRRGGSYGSAFA